MKILSNKKKIIEVLNSKKNIGFVPTMGSIHKGHISLIKKSINLCNKTVVSIFVNKPQFNKILDYHKYPRNLKKDINILRNNKVDYLYLPKDKEIYPNGSNKKIKISKVKKILCGKYRPGHFEAVVDVVDRLIKIIKPQKIFLGEKDMQQLKIIEEFLIKNKIETKVISCKIIREKNGLAYSSRNNLLKSSQKKIASNVYSYLLKKKRNLMKNKKLIKIIKKKLILLGINKLDYLEMKKISSFNNQCKENNRSRLFISYYLGNVRLIDNI